MMGTRGATVNSPRALWIAFGLSIVIAGSLAISLNCSRRDKGAAKEPASVPRVRLNAFVSRDSGVAVRAVERLLREDKLPPSSVLELVRRTGSEPYAILSYIRRTLRYEAYAGVMRGGDGALLSGGGNDLDLCLLLVKALQIANPNMSFKFMHAPITQTPSAQALRSERTTTITTQAAAKELGIDLATMQAHLENSGATGSVRSLEHYVEEEAHFLHANLPQLHRAQPGATSADHWWLRAQLPSGEWIDLDPAFDGLDQLHRRGQEGSIPETLFHKMRLLILIERVAHGRREEKRIYEGDWKTADLAGTSIALSFGPEGDNAEQWWKDTDRFHANIHLPDGSESSQGFDLRGETFAPDTESGIGGKMRSGASAVGTAVGNLLTGGLQSRGEENPAYPARDAVDSASVLTGISFEIAIIPAVGAVQTYRRSVLDRLDREAMSRGETKILDGWSDLARVRLACLAYYHLFPLVGPVGESLLGRGI